MSRGLKFDILLAVTLAYIFNCGLFAFPDVVPALLNAVGWLLSPENLAREILCILLTAILLIAPPMLVYWLRPKDGKALRFFVLWLLALGSVFLFFAALYYIDHPIIAFLAIPVAIILLWWCYFRPNFFFPDTEGDGNLTREPTFFYIGFILTLVGTELFWIMGNFLPHRNLHWAAILSLISPNTLLVAIICYLISLFRNESIRWPALALLIIAFMQRLYVADQTTLFPYLRYWL
jgi:hypothetical protein